MPVQTKRLVQLSEACDKLQRPSILKEIADIQFLAEEILYARGFDPKEVSNANDQLDNMFDSEAIKILESIIDAVPAKYLEKLKQGRGR